MKFTKSEVITYILFSLIGLIIGTILLFTTKSVEISLCIAIGISASLVVLSLQSSKEKWKEHSKNRNDTN